MSSENKITLAEARAAGFIIDYPEAPCGEGLPLYDGLFDPVPNGNFIAYDHFEKSPLTDLAGFLVGDRTRVPCFLKGYNRADAVADSCK